MKEVFKKYKGTMVIIIGLVVLGITLLIISCHWHPCSISNMNCSCTGICFCDRSSDCADVYKPTEYACSCIKECEKMRNDCSNIDDGGCDKTLYGSVLNCRCEYH
jgi:hypothetical protein